MRGKIFLTVPKLIARILQLGRTFFYKLVSNNEVKGTPNRHQPIQCMGLGEVLMGGTVNIGFPQSPFFFSGYCYLEARNVSALIEIGENTWINNNFCAIAEHQKIVIGERCFIGINVEIYDSDFHGQKIHERYISTCVRAKSVSIGSDVFVGSNCKILKGVTIGSGAIIAAGSVVVRDIEPMTIAGGNPAVFIKKIDF